MTEELLKKAKEAQSPEELLKLMQENGMDDFTKEDAEGLYTELHMTGELTDEEMENVSGGFNFNVTVGGQKYKVVTSVTECFAGHYDECLEKSDHRSLRKTWARLGANYSCGTCNHLNFTKALTGYCEIEHDL